LHYVFKITCLRPYFNFIIVFRHMKCLPVYIADYDDDVENIKVRFLAQQLAAGAVLITSTWFGNEGELGVYGESDAIKLVRLLPIDTVQALLSVSTCLKMTL